MKNFSIPLKIILVIALFFVLTIVVILYVTTKNRWNNLLLANEKTLATSAEMLNVTIRDIMLSGEAPIAGRTLENLQALQDIEELEIYRVDGNRAFQDYETLDVVNRNLGKTVFKKTERGENKTFDNGHFREVLDTIAPKRVELRNRREMEYYFPILNLPDCRVCHGSDHFIRGVAYFRASTQGVSDQIRNANLLLTGMFVIAGILISAVLVLFLRRTVTSPILTIGGTVLKVGKGDFGVRVPVKSSDEIGRLGKEINQMIQGLENRFHFPKYVAKTTENLMRKRGEIRTDGERQNLTVLFSDIRQFTRFSKSNQPAEVIKTLNRFLQVQAETVEKFQGDIDKFIGDAIMALFTDEYTAVQCAYHMIASVRSLDRELGSGLRVGIGINAGEVVLGNIGSERRLEFGVIGDVVNMASRLSSIASPNMILISESVMKKLEGRVRAKLISDQQVNRKLKKLNFFVVQEVKDESTQRWMR